VAGYLTTHVLDTARGRPAADMRVELFRLDRAEEGRDLIAATRTNDQGRTDAPLVEEGELSRGVYELVFEVGEYFAGQPETGSADPPFLDRVAVRFGVADPAAHYHVPLLASPWSYATYRGS
jgi:5-hydroxyisourate hydrolase